MKSPKESLLSAITTVPTASVLGILSVALGMASSPAFAASATWTGLGADSAWTTTGNWSASPVPGSGDTATFNGSGNGKTTITTAPAALTSYVFDTASAAAYTISAASTTWSVPNGGGVTINSTVTTNQDLSGIQFIRPASGTTTAFINDAANTTLRLGTIFNSNTSNGNARLNFSPASGATIELISGKFIDNATTAGRTTSVLINTSGTFKMAGTGGFSGTDGDGNSVTIRQGTFMASVIANANSGRTSLGSGGRIQFGYGTTANTATLDYYSTANAATDRSFYIIDNATAVFKVSGGAGTNLELTTGITQSASTNGGGKLTKEGSGTLTLTGTNTYAGATTVNAGVLNVKGSTAAGSAVAVGGDAATGTPTLGGSGTINGAVTVKSAGGGAAGRLDAGDAASANPAGKLTVNNNLTFESGSIFEWDIKDGATVTESATGRGVEYDAVDITGGGALSITGGVFRVVLNTGAFNSGSFWDANRTWASSSIFSTGGSLAGFTSLEWYEGATLKGQSSNLAGRTTDGYFSISGSSLQWTAIPELSNVLIGSLLGAGLLRRRRKA